MSRQRTTNELPPYNPDRDYLYRHGEFRCPDGYVYDRLRADCYPEDDEELNRTLPYKVMGDSRYPRVYTENKAQYDNVIKEERKQREARLAAEAIGAYYPPRKALTTPRNRGLEYDPPKGQDQWERRPLRRSRGSRESVSTRDTVDNLFESPARSRSPPRVSASRDSAYRSRSPPLVSTHPVFKPHHPLASSPLVFVPPPRESASRIPSHVYPSGKNTKLVNLVERLKYEICSSGKNDRDVVLKIKELLYNYDLDVINSNVSRNPTPSKTAEVIADVKEMVDTVKEKISPAVSSTVATVVESARQALSDTVKAVSRAVSPVDDSSRKSSPKPQSRVGTPKPQSRVGSPKSANVSKDEAVNELLGLDFDEDNEDNVSVNVSDVDEFDIEEEKE